MSVNLPGRRLRPRHYWRTYNRPFRGCSCLYTLILIVLIWFVGSFFCPSLAFWQASIGPALGLTF
jgi:hypothetical protein